MRPFARLAAAMAVTLLAACQMQVPKTSTPTSDLTPLAPDTISVTTLDSAPASQGKTVPTVVAPAVSVPAVPAITVPVQVPTKTTPRPMPRPKGMAAATTSAKTSAKTPPTPQETAAPAAPPPPIPPEQAICQKAGGQWSTVAASSGRICVHRTPDSGKACRRKSDCQGQCLAQSGTCAPISPLMGCNDILQADGTRMTLCLQ